MTAERTSLDWEALEDAFGALQPFYDPEDDGDGVRLSLDAIASLLADCTEREIEGDEPLSTLLVELDAPKKLLKMVDDLYEAAQGGSYGEGMSQEQANTVNDLVEAVYDPLHRFLKKVERGPRKRASVRKGTTKPKAGPKKKTKAKPSTKTTTSKNKMQAGRKRSTSTKGRHAS